MKKAASGQTVPAAQHGSRLLRRLPMPHPSEKQNRAQLQSALPLVVPLALAVLLFAGSALGPVGSIQAASTWNIAKTHSGTFTQGQMGATYTITVTNGSSGSSSGTVTVVDTLPTGLTAAAMSGTGWTCTLATLTCTRSDPLARNVSYPPITLTVNVADNAPANVTNTAAVSGGGITGSNVSDPTTIVQLADLTAAKTHNGNFNQGQIGASYAITVTNSGNGSASGTVTVVDTLPTGLTATAMSGTGWTCTLGTLTCTRSNTLAPGTSYPVITLTVNVASNAPASVTNTATVSGGGQIITGNDSAHDPTTINQLPTITSLNATTFTVGTFSSFTVTATGSPAPTFSETGALPSGVTFNAATGVLSGTPVLGSGGVYSITLAAQNVAGNAVQNFALTVNEAPAITSASSATFVIGVAHTFAITTRGYPAATISESGALPNSITFTDNGNGTATLAGTPDAGTTGGYLVDITAHNGIGTDSVQPFTLTVNQLPKITSPDNVAFTVGEAGSFSVTATGYPAPTFGTTGMLPTGVTLSSAGLLSGMPAVGSGGVYTFTITASNGTPPNANQAFTLTVYEAAAITSADHTSFIVGEAGSFTLTTRGYPFPALGVSGTLPGGITFTNQGNGTGMLEGTPGMGTAGVYGIVFSADNGGPGDPPQDFTLTVNQIAAITSANSKTFVVSTPDSFTVMATGFPTPTLSESGTLPGGVAFDPTTGLLSGTPAAGTAGGYPITFTAHNGIAGDAIQSFVLIVAQAPAITSGASATFNTGMSDSFSVTTSGYPTPTLSSSGGLPTGVTFTDNHNGTATLGGAPAIGTSGTYHIMITASNGIGSDDTQSFTLTINEAAAVITSGPSATFRTGTPGAFTVTTTGIPVPTITTTSTLPTGVTLTDNHNSTATLAGTPASGTGGIYAISIKAHNGVGDDATQTFTLTVNQAPVIASANSATFVVGSAGAFTVNGTGFPAITLSISGTLPGGVMFSDNHDGSGTLAGTPSVGAGCSYSLVLTASNGIPPDATQSFTLAVNQAASITSGDNATFLVGSSGTFTVTATGYPAPTLGETGILPTGVTFNTATGVLSGTPTLGTGGVYSISFGAHNVAGDATQSFTLTVNEAPSFNSSNSATFTTNTPSSFSITTHGYPKPSVGQSGILPSGLTFTDNHDGTATLAGTPAVGTGGSYPLTFMAQNGIGTDASQPFTFIVNQPPAFTSANNTTFTVGSVGSFNVAATGYPAPTFSSTGTRPSGVTLSSSGLLSGTPATGSGGVYTLALTASNGALPNANQTFTLTVNEAATIRSASSVNFTVGAAGSFAVTTYGYPKPSLSESGTLPSGVTFVDAGNGTGTLAGTPAAGTGGNYPITFTAHNGIGSDGTQTFTLVVVQSPVITSGNSTTFTVGTSSTFTVTASGDPVPTFSSTALPSGLSLNATSGVLGGTASLGTGGVYTITITAANGGLPNATQAFMLTINEAPGFTSGSSTTFTANTAGSFGITTRGYPKPSIGQSGALPSGVAFVDNGNGTATLAGTPAASTGGSYPLTLTASNGIGTNSSQPFTLIVNQPPAFTSVNNTAFLLGSAGSFTVTTTGYPAPSISKQGGGSLPTGVSLTDNGNGTATIAGTPSGAPGLYSITIRATNGVGGNVNQDFTLTVNQLPAITSANVATFTVGTAGSFGVIATGYPAPTLSESGALPAGVTFVTSTGLLSGTPAVNSGGAYPITFTAQNSVGTLVQAFTLTVNEAASFTSANTTSFNSGSAGSFTITTRGYPKPTLSKTGTLPGGVTFTDNANGTATLAGTPALGSGGTYTITVTAHNGISIDATQTFRLTVNEAAAVITSGNSATFLVGTAGSFTVTASGIPTPTIATTSTLPGGVTLTDNGNGTATLTGTPSVASGGSYPILLRAHNGVGSDGTQSLTLVVNEAAAITSANSATLTTGAAGTFTITTRGYPKPSIVESGAMPSGVTFSNNGNGTATLAGTPGGNTGGSYLLALTAHNSSGSDATQTLTLIVNQPPAFTSAPSTIFVVGTSGSFTVTTAGYPAVTLSMSGTLPPGITFDAGTGVLSGTPPAGSAGIYPISFSAQNGVLPNSSQNYTLFVHQAPVITSGDTATFTVGTADSFTVTATGYPTPMFSSTALPSGLSLNTTTGVLSGNPTLGTGGTYSITLTAHNSVGDASKTCFLTINQAAEITTANTTTFVVGATGSFNVSVTGYPAPTLAESGALPGGVSFAASTGTLSGTPAAGTAGLYSITFTAHNGVGADATQSFALTVGQAPTITSAGVVTFTVDVAGSFNVIATGYPAPTFTSIALPNGLTLDSSGILSGTPTAATVGAHTATVYAHNGIGSDASQALTINVTQAPRITSANAVTFTVGTAGTFNVTEIGFPDPTMSLSGTLPGGLAFDAENCILSGTPTAGAGAMYSITFTAHNGVGSDAVQNFTLTVNEAATITSVDHVTLLVGTASTFSATAIGYPAPTYSSSALPGGLTLNAAVGALNGIPAVGTGGVYSITLTAHNGIGSDASQTLILTVNEAAALTSVNTATFTAGTAGSSTVTASGFPAPTLGQSGNLPAGITFNASTGVLSGTPAVGTGGSYTLTFTAHNGIGTDATQDFALIVRQAPAITSGNTFTFTVGTSSSFSMTATGYPAPTFSSTSLPSGLTLNATTGVLSGTPAAGTGGAYSVTLTAHNGVGSDAAQPLALTVNDAAGISSGATTTFLVGNMGSFTVTATGYPAPTLGQSGGLPTGVSFNASTGVLSGTPAAGTGGTYSITFSAHNGIGNDAIKSFTLTVNEPPLISSANRATFTVGSAGSFSVTATGFPVSTFSETGALPDGITLNGGGLLGGTPAAGSTGAYTVTLSAHNGVGGDATQIFTLTVNERPTITSVASTTFIAGTSGYFHVTAAGYPAPTLSQAGSLPGGVAFDANSGVLSGTPAAGSGGVYSFTFTAQNGVGPNAVQNFTLTVGQAPTISAPGSATFVVGTNGSFTFTGTGYPAPAFSETGALPSGVSLSIYGELSGTPAVDMGGVYNITVTASNGVPPNASQSLTLTVVESPAFTNVAATAFVVGASGSFTVTRTGYPMPTLSQTGNLPNGITFNAATGVLSGLPAAGSAGVYPVIFTAHNGIGNDATQTFTLTVNQVPNITSVGSTTFIAGATNTFHVIATGYPLPTLSVNGALPGGVTFTAATGILGGTPSAGAGGVYSIGFTAHNGVGSDAAQSFTLTVNEAPAITSANAFSFTVGMTGLFHVTDIGYPAPSISLSGTLPSGVTFDTNTGVLSGTPASGTGGSYPLVFTAHNGIGADGTQSFTLIVNQPAAITSANHTTFTAGSLGSFTVTGTGYPAPTFSETGQLPTGVTFNTSSHVLGGTPAAATGGTYSITFTAHNGVGGDATQSFLLTVNEAASITSPDHASFAVGAARSFTVTGGGYPAPTFSSTILPAGLSLDAGTGVLSGMPAAGTSGTYSVTLTAHNGVGTDAVQAFTLTVNQPLVITSPNVATFTVGTAGSFTVTASGYPAPTFSSTALPAGLVLNPTSGVLSGTPTIGTGGAYSITITAHNGVGADVTQNFALTVNEAAAITSANNATFTMGTAGTFNLTATGYPAPTKSLTGALPGGVTFNASTGILSGTPTTGAGGTWLLTFTAHNGIGADATQALTLTVNEAPAVTLHPSNLTVNLGQTAIFTSTASGMPAPTTQWAVSTDGGSTWNDIAGATSTTLAFTAQDAHHGNLYRAVHTNLVGSSTSTFAVLAVNTPPLITTTPISQAACPSSGVSFATAATGRPTPTVQWQYRTDGGADWADVVGATSLTLSVTASPALNGYQYRAVFTNVVGTQTTAAATLGVNTTPTITTQPASQTVVHGQSVTFTAAVNGNPAPAVQWQVSTDGGATFSNISGATSITLTLTVTRSDDGKQYRAVFNNLCSSASTAAATLSVNKMDTTTALVSSANPSAPGRPVSFTATVHAKVPGAGVTTGTVTFKDGATILGVKTVDANGNAALTVPSISSGHHSITAQYGGDANAMGSTSSALDQVGNNVSTFLPMVVR